MTFWWLFGDFFESQKPPKSQKLFEIALGCMYPSRITVRLTPFFWHQDLERPRPWQCLLVGSLLSLLIVSKPFYMGPRRSKRARTLKNDAMSANDTHIEKTGRAGDRERYLIREWLAYPKTTFNKKKAAELLLPNIEIWAKLHCSDWKSLEFNVSMIGMIL